MHDGELGGEYLPALHELHLTELRLEYVPAPQLLHCVDLTVPPEVLLAWNPSVQFKQPSVNGTGA